MGTEYYVIRKDYVLEKGLEFIFNKTIEDVMKETIERLKDNRLYDRFFDGGDLEQKAGYQNIGKASATGAGSKGHPTHFYTYLTKDELEQMINDPEYLIIDADSMIHCPEKFKNELGEWGITYMKDPNRTYPSQASTPLLFFKEIQ